MGSTIVRKHPSVGGIASGRAAAAGSPAPVEQLGETEKPPASTEAPTELTEGAVSRQIEPPTSDDARALAALQRARDPFVTVTPGTAAAERLLNPLSFRADPNEYLVAATTAQSLAATNPELALDLLTTIGRDIENLFIEGRAFDVSTDGRLVPHQGSPREFPGRERALLALAEPMESALSAVIEALAAKLPRDLAAWDGKSPALFQKLSQAAQDIPTVQGRLGGQEQRGVLKGLQVELTLGAIDQLLGRGTKLDDEGRRSAARLANQLEGALGSEGLGVTIRPYAKGAPLQERGSNVLPLLRELGRVSASPLSAEQRLEQQQPLPLSATLEQLNDRLAVAEQHVELDFGFAQALSAQLSATLSLLERAPRLNEAFRTNPELAELLGGGAAQAAEYTPEQLAPVKQRFQQVQARLDALKPAQQAIEGLRPRVEDHGALLTLSPAQYALIDGIRQPVDAGVKALAGPTTPQQKAELESLIARALPKQLQVGIRTYEYALTQPPYAKAGPDEQWLAKLADEGSLSTDGATRQLAEQAKQVLTRLQDRRERSVASAHALISNENAPSTAKTTAERYERAKGLAAAHRLVDDNAYGPSPLEKKFNREELELGLELLSSALSSGSREKASATLEQVTVLRDDSSRYLTNGEDRAGSSYFRFQALRRDVEALAQFG